MHDDAPLMPVPHDHRALEAKQTKGRLVAGFALVAVVAVGVGGFFVMRGDETPELVEDSREVVPDTTPDDTADYSFAAATANALAAASMRMEIVISSSEGPATATLTVDRASARMSVDLDLSQVEPDDDAEIPVPDSYSMIIDERTSAVYVGSEVFGGLIPIETTWLRLPDDDGDLDDIEDVFSNPFDIATAFGDAEPIEVGTEFIDGEELAHFRVTVEEIDAESAWGGSFDGQAVTYDVWVSADDQIRRVAYEAEQDGELARFDMTMHLSADSVDIDLPDPADVTDFSDLWDFEAIDD